MIKEFFFHELQIEGLKVQDVTRLLAGFIMDNRSGCLAFSSSSKPIFAKWQKTR
jgi:hypothetical protein